ncbi:PD-(D/E)XK motif protein [Nonomuraea salmonea]|uniref:PD-(D/E)XK motif protein n=1 Tax=Nonomuraea salmonea TaxID=46181 RepID=UPI00360C2B68
MEGDILTCSSRRSDSSWPPIRLLAVADRIQLDGHSLEVALQETLRSLGRLLEREDTLPREQEVGLFGELLLLRGLLYTFDHTEAVTAWLGADGEEHDFALEGVDLEVKTTASDLRMHWIGSLTQLVPNPSQPLLLVSFQITKAGPGDGNTLPALVGGVRELLGMGEARNAFEARLQRSGWQDQYEPNTRTLWRLRDKPRVYEVSGDFPRLTPMGLGGVQINLAQLSAVKYRIDLSNRLPDPVPAFLAQALRYGEEDL